MRNAPYAHESEGMLPSCWCGRGRLWDLDDVDLAGGGGMPLSGGGEWVGFEG